MSSDDTSTLFESDPNQPPALALRQGIVQSWNADTGENQVEYGGGVLANLPALVSESAELAAGDVVALLVTNDRVLVMGKVITPGDPGTVPTWNADITALAPLTGLAAVTSGTTITGATNITSDPGDGRHVVINDPAYPGEIVLKSGNVAEIDPARIRSAGLGGANFGALELRSPDLGAPGGYAFIELDGFDDHTTISTFADFMRVEADTLVLTGFTEMQIGDGTNHLTVVGDAISEADLSSPTNTFPATSAWTDLPLANAWVSDTGRTAQYCKDMTGRVQLRGRVKSGTNTLPIATLPLGFRPTQTMEWTLRSHNGIIVCAIEVRTDGTIVAVGNSGTVSTAGGNIDCISFPTN